MVRTCTFLPTTLEFRECRRLVGDFLQFAEVGAESPGTYVKGLPDELYSGFEKVRRKNIARLPRTEFPPPLWAALFRRPSKNVLLPGT